MRSVQVINNTNDAAYPIKVISNFTASSFKAPIDFTTISMVGFYFIVRFQVTAFEYIYNTADSALHK